MIKTFGHWDKSHPWHCRKLIDKDWEVGLSTSGEHYGYGFIGWFESKEDAEKHVFI